ncbi:MAG: hypothetical protein KDA44_22600 [Planctomycetales bacterium]|nr:hypothetical protein [Planctomycetales bacterium]
MNATANQPRRSFSLASACRQVQRGWSPEERTSRALAAAAVQHRLVSLLLLNEAACALESSGLARFAG